MNFVDIQYPRIKRPVTDVEKIVPLARISKAYQSSKHLIKKTPITKSQYFSIKYDCNVYFKREDLHEIRSFKIRGALNKFQNLTQEGKSKGVVCSSAGNHAQGVAYCCNKLKVKGTIFMALNSPEIKVKNVKLFGGEWVTVRQVGNNFDEASRAAKEY